MHVLTDYPRIDIIVVVIANLINLGMVSIFLLRTRHRQRLERRIGWLQIALAVPLLIILIYNVIERREWWTIVMPALLITFLLVELMLDYILRWNFRQTWLLGPYLLLYYTALMGMIGYAFLTSELLGFVTLTTYFAQLGATAYSYRKVGHGPGPDGQPVLSGEPN
jgi:hypothetical protein